MRILLLSFYYPPDIGPGSLRAKSIVDALIESGPSDLKIDVITTMPNRYNSLKISALVSETYENISIQRIILPEHKNGIFDQAKAFLSFSFQVQKIIFKKKWDIVIATSSRLMTASLGAWIAKQTKSKLFLDIRDIFTETVKNILAKKFYTIFVPIFNILEKWTFRSADKINVVSEGFLNHFSKIVPNKFPSVYTNGVDEIFLKKKFISNKIKSKPLILYTGNIGEGQGLHKIIPEAANELKNIQFRLIGDGSTKNLLIENNLFKSQNNIELLKPIMRENLIIEYQKADILFLHLNSYNAFNKVLPSKIFEYAATGKPILAGVSGYASEFLLKHINGVEIFNPCDVKNMKIGLEKLLNGPKIFNRDLFLNNYDRRSIMKKMTEEILSISKKV